MSVYQKILVPIDGSPTSNRGLIEAIKLAKNQHATLRLVHLGDGADTTRAEEFREGDKQADRQ